MRVCRNRAVWCRGSARRSACGGHCPSTQPPPGAQAGPSLVLAMSLASTVPRAEALPLCLPESSSVCGQRSHTLSKRAQGLQLHPIRSLGNKTQPSTLLLTGGRSHCLCSEIARLTAWVVNTVYYWHTYQ